jgi:thiol-disulfide isomerase/thioredoxin
MPNGNRLSLPHERGLAMKNLLVTVALVGLIAATGRADDPKPAVSLKDGDPAPALKAGKWLQGEEVKEFEAGKVYVVEFWATWCGPCILFMPQLAELQLQYKDQGVTCIGFTARDPDNTEEKVAAFVKKRGPKLPYTFAYADDRTTFDAWMTAAGRAGIPCTFVVDRAGRIAFIGSPMYLGVVLPRVVTGDRKAQAVAEEVAKIEEEFGAVSAALFPDNQAGLRRLRDFEAKYPALANNPIILRVKLSLLPEVGQVDEARKVAEAVMAKALVQANPSALMQVSSLLRLGPGKKSKELLAVAVKAGEAAVQVAGDKDARALINLASTYFQAGDRAKASEYARKAVAAAGGESAALKQSVEQEAKRIEEGKNEDTR